MEGGRDGGEREVRLAELDSEGGAVGVNTGHWVKPVNPLYRGTGIRYGQH